MPVPLPVPAEMDGAPATKGRSKAMTSREGAGEAAGDARRHIVIRPKTDQPGRSRSAVRFGSRGRPSSYRHSAEDGPARPQPERLSLRKPGTLVVISSFGRRGTSPAAAGERGRAGTILFVSSISADLGAGPSPNPRPRPNPTPSLSNQSTEGGRWEARRNGWLLAGTGTGGAGSLRALVGSTARAPPKTRPREGARSSHPSSAGGFDVRRPRGPDPCPCPCPCPCPRRWMALWRRRGARRR